ncbi:MAG: hypothetical protein J6P45_08685 [Lachnospiraceae bacterium]|nr:hypothetical protein [Lachnospiraceae bacterium]
MEEKTEAGLEAQEKTEDKLIVNGIRYISVHDAAAAKEEIKKIDYIKSRMNFNNPEEVYAIYDKMIDNRLFVTPTGYEFLFDIKKYLEDAPGIDNSSIKVIQTESLFTQRARNEARAENRPPSREQDLKNELKKNQTGYRTSVIINIFLVILVIAMFVIALSSDTPNMLNYRTAIENEYSEWEEELKKRESELSRREKEQGTEGDENAGAGGIE